MRSKRPRFLVLSTVLLVWAGGISALAQDGKLNIHVTPKQAYVFLDGRAMGEASKPHSFSLTAGDHKIQLANYGYEPESRMRPFSRAEIAARSSRSITRQYGERDPSRTSGQD